MIEIGESSRARGEEPQEIALDLATAGPRLAPDEEVPRGERDSTSEAEQVVFRDIPVDTEQLIEIAPVGLEPEEGEDYILPSASPVRGGVMRFEGGSDEDDAETDQTPESDPEEDEPAEYADDMGTTADDIIEALTTRTVELEDQVHHLEEQDQVHQHMEDQYRDIAYQRQADIAELRETNQELMRQLEQEVSLSDRFRAERDATRAELQAVRRELALERETRESTQEAWGRATVRIDSLEEQVRSAATRVDTAAFALDTAMGRLRSRIRRFPREEDLSRQVISRRIVDHMVRQEHEDAILRSDQ